GNFRWHGKDCENSPCTDDDFDEYLDRLEGIRSFGHGNHNGWAFGRHFGSRLTPYLYTGRRYSEITNQTWHRNRYYSPALGRFSSKDPIGFNGGNNLYRYADNNPMRYVDPLGLTVVTDVIKNYFLNETSGLWLMDSDDEYTKRVIRWDPVINLVNRAKYALETNCKAWEATHMTDPNWLPGKTDNPTIFDPNTFLQHTTKTSDPLKTVQQYVNFLVYGTIEESLWTNAIGRFQLSATVDEIDCSCNKAKIRFWMFNGMDKDSLGKKNSSLVDLLGPYQSEQFMWWFWTVDHNW
ncbi:MAG: RHS repeat-associated core domain-containing protein, partial [Candidatus Riflebacteria bacterium]